MSKKIIAKSGGQLQPERPGHFQPEKGGQFHPEKAGVLIRNIHNEYPYLYKKDENLYIDYYKLYVNVIKLENFINNNPNFFLLNEIKNRYSDELHKMIYGTKSDPIYEYETNILKPEIKKLYEKVISKNESRNSTKEIINNYNKLNANNFIKITEEEEVAQTNTNTNTSQNSNVHSSDNNWVIGVWEVQTDAGLMNLTILDSQNATFLGDKGKYTIDNGVLNWRDKFGIVSPFKLNYSNQTIDGGGGYVLRKRNVSSNNSQTSRSPSNQSTKGYNRTYRDYFENESAIREFLSNHTFVSSDGIKIYYNMSELTISFPGGKKMQYINIQISGYNQDIARIGALCTTVRNTSVTLTLNAANGTITDGQTVFRALN